MNNLYFLPDHRCCVLLCLNSPEEAQVSPEPLIDVLDGGRYTGEQLAHLISDLQEKLESDTPSEEFKVY